MQKIYQRETPYSAKSYEPMLWPNEVAEPEKARIEQTGLFGPVTVRRYPWNITYDATGYLRLLDTFSNHRALEANTRERLYKGIADLIETQYSGRIVKGYMALLYLAHRQPEPRKK